LPCKVVAALLFFSLYFFAFSRFFAFANDSHLWRWLFRFASPLALERRILF
jgi:hypothetical protein